MEKNFDTGKYLKEFKKEYGENFSLSMETRDCSQFTSDLININVQDELNKGTLLHYACKFGEIEAVKYLIKNGANRFIEDSNGETPIFYILKFCDNVDLIRTVLGVDESFPHISELLLHKNFENFDVMQIAIQNGRRNIANYLLQKFPEFYVLSTEEYLTKLPHNDNSFNLAVEVDAEFRHACTQNKFYKNAQQRFNKMTLLHYACNFGEFEAVKYLIKNGVNPFIEDINAETAIFHAIKFGDNLDLIKILLGVTGCFIHFPKYLLHKNYENFDVVHVAVQNGRINIVEYLLKEFYKFYEISTFKSLINLAAAKNYPKILEIIADFYSSKNDGLKIDFSQDTKNWRETSTFKFIAKNDGVECLKILLDKTVIPETNLNFNKYFEILKEAISYSAKNIFEHVESVKTFEEIKEICRKSDGIEKNTLLHLAVKKGNFEIFMQLIKYFDNIQLLNKFGETSLHIAAKEGRREMFKALFKISSFLVIFPSNKNLCDKNETPLSIICEKNLQSLILFVCDNMDLTSTKMKCYNFEKNKKCSIFQMSLLIAIETQNVFLLKRLIKNSDDFENGEKAAILLKGLKHSIKKKFVTVVDCILKLDSKRTFFRYVFNIDNEEEETPFKLLIEFLPDIALWVLDRFNEDTKKYGFSELNIFNDTRDTGKNRFISKTHPIYLMIKYKRIELLRHPLVDTYIDAKWNRFARWYYYSALFFQIILVIYSSILLVSVIPESSTKQQNETVEVVILSHKRICLLSLSHGCFTFGVILWLLQFMAIIFRNSWNIISRCKDKKFGCRSAIYYLAKHDCLNIIILINFAFVILPVCEFKLIFQFTEILIFNFLIWLSLFKHLKQHPRLGVYVVMMTFILKSFVRFLPILIIILLPFVFKFFVVLKKRKDLSFFQMFVRTLAMMYGDFNYPDNFEYINKNISAAIVNDTLGDENDGFSSEQYNFIKPILFCLFLLIAIIFLNNLVLGLAVDNVSKILEDAYIQRRILQIQSIHHIENAMPLWLKRLCWSKYFKMQTSIFASKENSQCCPKNIKNYTSWLTKYFGLPKKSMTKETNLEEQIKKIETKLNSLETLMEKMLKKLEKEELS